jgi:hypothetical protein
VLPAAAAPHDREPPQFSEEQNVTDDSPVADEQRPVEYDDEEHPEPVDREWWGLAGPRGRLMSAADTLRMLLTDSWQPALKIQRRMTEARFSVDETRTARKHLGVSKDTGAVAFIDGRWHWRQRPGGCPTCGHPWRPQGNWRADYWGDRPSTPVSHQEANYSQPWDEPPAPLGPPTRPAPLMDLGPPRCNICGKASALELGSSCPYWGPTGQRCSGRMT